MCTNQNSGSGEGGRDIGSVGGWATPQESNDHFGAWGRPSAREREQHQRQERQGRGRPPGRGTRSGRWPRPDGS